MGNRTARAQALTNLIIVTLTAGTLAVCLSGCDKKPPGKEGDLLELREELTRKLPEGWKVSYARDLNFALLAPTAKDDLVVWRTEKVKLERLGSGTSATQPSEPMHIYFTLAVRDFIDPGQYPGLWKKNNDIEQKHKYALAKLSNVPRDDKGHYMTRGVAESLEVSRLKAEYDKLPPYDPNFPTHYVGSVAFKLHDWRPVLLPEVREHQQEQNSVYTVITEPLTKYRR